MCELSEPDIHTCYHNRTLCDSGDDEDGGDFAGGVGGWEGGYCLSGMLAIAPALMLH